MGRWWKAAAIGGVTCAVLAWIFALPPVEPAPVFWENKDPKGEFVACGTGRAAGENLFLRFENEGRRAIVRAGKRALVLDYATSNGFEDVYRGGGWSLTLDPEVNLTGPGGVSFGPVCDRG